MSTEEKENWRLLWLATCGSSFIVAATLIALIWLLTTRAVSYWAGVLALSLTVAGSLLLIVSATIATWPPIIRYRGRR